MRILEKYDSCAFLRNATTIEANSEKSIMGIFLLKYDQGRSFLSSTLKNRFLADIGELILTQIIFSHLIYMCPEHSSASLSIFHPLQAWNFVPQKGTKQP